MNEKTNYMTTAPVSAPGVINKFEPEFVRLPKPRTRCPKTGLSRSKMCELVLPCSANGFKPPVRSVVLRSKGKVRGVRLIDFASLMAYLNSCGLVEVKEATHEA
ncbi:MAG: hypothetical protein M1608_02175 [Candidatus Omnitrophica bacterium]|nr:hypothetical protein [Candidatus Omnitrophota bacterium]